MLRCVYFRSTLCVHVFRTSRKCLENNLTFDNYLNFIITMLSCYLFVWCVCVCIIWRVWLLCFDARRPTVTSHWYLRVCPWCDNVFLCVISNWHLFSLTFLERIYTLQLQFSFSALSTSFARLRFPQFLSMKYRLVRLNNGVNNLFVYICVCVCEFQLKRRFWAIT